MTEYIDGPLDLIMWLLCIFNTPLFFVTLYKKEYKQAFIGVFWMIVGLFMIIYL